MSMPIKKGLSCLSCGAVAAHVVDTSAHLVCVMASLHILFQEKG